MSVVTQRLSNNYVNPTSEDRSNPVRSWSQEVQLRFATYIPDKWTLAVIPVTEVAPPPPPQKKKKNVERGILRCGGVEGGSYSACIYIYVCDERGGVSGWKKLETETVRMCWRRRRYADTNRKLDKKMTRTETSGHESAVAPETSAAH